jgi:predicted nucleotidyltransferase
MNVDSKNIPDRFRPDLERAVAVLREHGAQEIYLFGSIVEPFGDMEPDDIDIAVSGVPAESFLHAYGILLGELEHRFDLIDLDEDNRFSRRLRERGKLERVA